MLDIKLEVDFAAQGLCKGASTGLDFRSGVLDFETCGLVF